MSDIKPYAESTASQHLLGEPHAYKAADGWSWIVGGFNLFKRAPGMWIGIILLWVAISYAISHIPVINIAGYFIDLIFASGMILACKKLDQGEKLEIVHLFAGFKQNPWQVVAVGAIYLGAMLGILMLMGLLVVIILAGNAMISDTSIETLNLESLSNIGESFEVGVGIMLMLAMLTAFALSIPVIMAFWFAPTLVVLNNYGPIEAMKASFAGCLRNIVPLLFYSLLIILLSIVAMIPLMLGLLVLVPVLLGSVYVSYKHIFLGQSLCIPLSSSD